MTKQVKLYQVTFRKYADVLKTRVCKNEDGDPTTKDLYLSSEELLVRQDELVDYQEFGGGFYSIKYVGSMYTEPLKIDRV